MLDTTPRLYTPAWHAAQEVDERAWLDDWARLHLIPVTPEPQPATAAPAPSLTTARSH